ncbi:helix-turn-helix transcriptional regulator [Microbacterium paludicola]|uniref:helix-turn-helix transcriptional regulator n=1 Tax=Microbacterium paludicola TaxID=300019 RepID=UPI0031E0E119
MPGTSSRMLSLLSLLQARHEWTGPALAERLGVTGRTVRRDIERLRDLGYAIAATKGSLGGYRLAAGAELPPLLFDEEQAVAVAVALRSAASGGVELEEAAARALATVRQVMPSHLRHRVDAVAFTGSPPPERVDPTVLEAVSAAVRDTRTLRFDYGDDEERPARRVEPHAVVSRNQRWYLVAWDLGRSEWRIFRLDRMRPRTPGGAPFARRALPTGDAAAFVAARAKGSEAEDRWPCEGEFVIGLPARSVAPWIGDGLLEELPDGTTRVRVGAWSWVGLLAWVLRFDAPFTVVGPAPLRAAAAPLAARLSSSVG